MIYDNKIDDRRIQINKDKAKAFFEKQIPVHILKIDREWFNGLLLEVKNEFLTINEKKRGTKIVVFREIFDINQLEVVGV